MMPWKEPYTSLLFSSSHLKPAHILYAFRFLLESPNINSFIKNFYFKNSLFFRSFSYIHLYGNF